MVARLNLDLIAGEVEEVGDDGGLFGTHQPSDFLFRALCGGDVGQAGGRCWKTRHGGVGHAHGAATPVGSAG